MRVYLQPLTDFLAAICKVSAPQACQNVMQVAVVMQACLRLLVGPTLWQSALLGLKSSAQFLQCYVTFYITWMSCTLHRLELPACCLAWLRVNKLSEKCCNSQ